MQLQDWPLGQYGESKLGDRFPQAEPDFADTDGLERSLWGAKCDAPEIIETVGAAPNGELGEAAEHPCQSLGKQEEG